MTKEDDPDACWSPEGAAQSVERALRLLEGRWKLAIVFHLFAAPVLRFSELERAIQGVSQKMLAKQLRELERDGLVHRTVHPEVPPRVEYRLTPLGEASRPAMAALREWSAGVGPAPDDKPRSSWRAGLGRSGESALRRSAGEPEPQGGGKTGTS